MGAGSDLIFGGLLSGLGQGMQQNELANRQAALEALREQRADARQEIQTRDTFKRDDIQQQNAMERQDQEGKQRVEQLQISGGLQAQRDAAGRSHDITMAQLRSQLDGARSASEIRLRHSLEAGEVQSVQVDQDGNYVVFYRGGSNENTGIQARPQASQTEGGRLTESEQGTAYSAAHRRWVQGGRTGTEPQRTDFIGLSREDFHRNEGASPAPPAPAAPRRPATPANGYPVGTVITNGRGQRMRMGDDGRWHNI